MRLYGLVYPTRLPSPEPISLAQLDPRTLAPLGRPTLLGRFIGFAVLSPDGRRVAVAEPRRSVLRLYEGVTPVGRVVLAGRRGQVRQIVWTAPDRLVAIVQRMSEPYARSVRARYAVGVDAVRGRVLFRTRFDRRLALTGSGASGGRAALLYQSSSLLARRARLTVIGADGTVRSAPLHFGSGPTRRLFVGLAVDPALPRAYAVLSGGRVAVVDLRTLRVRYHTIRALPGAAASEAPLVLLRAATLGRHALVVSGLVERSSPGREPPVGISVVDTRTWRARTLDPRAWTFAVAGDTVVTAGRGVTGYAADGTRLYHLLDATPVSRIQIVQGRAHAWLGGTRQFAPTRVMIFGPRSGTIFGRVTMSGRMRVAVLDSNGY